MFKGQVHDGNAYILGGINGHAGLFSNAPDLVKFLRAYLRPDGSTFLNATTVKLMSTEYNTSQRSRALGWNTNDAGIQMCTDWPRWIKANQWDIDLYILQLGPHVVYVSMLCCSSIAGVRDEGWGLSCGSHMSSTTFMHIGYSGTMLCVDPKREVFTILLTNRVYPSVCLSVLMVA